MAKRSDGYSALDEFEREYVRPKPGRTLIVGSHVYRNKEDRRKRYPDAVGWDLLAGDGVDRVIDLEQPLPADVGTFMHIECVSVLEHSRRPWELAANIETMLEAGGTLHVGVPFIWRVHAYPDDFWRFTVSGIKELFPKIKWAALMYANQGLTKKVRRIWQSQFWYYPRTEVVGFGKKI